MKGAMAVLAITILTASSLFAQVHIKENATITPGQAKGLQDGVANNHTITFELHWDPTQYGMVGWQAYWDQTLGACPVDYAIDSSSSSYILTLLSPPAQFYSMWANLGVQHIGGDSMVVAHYSWTIYCDNVLVASDSGSKFLCCWGNGDTPWIRCGGADFLTPYYANFSFALSIHQIQSGGSAGMSVAGMYNEDYNQDCGSTWSTTDPLTLTITSGSQYASFHGPDPQTGEDTKLDSVVLTTGSDIGKYSLVADGAPPDSNNCYVTVDAKSGATARSGTVQILPSPDHFEVTVSPDTIAHSDTGSTTIYVQAKDAANEDIDYEGAIMISASPAGYGDLGNTEPPEVGNMARGNPPSGHPTTKVLQSLPSFNHGKQEQEYNDVDGTVYCEECCHNR